MSEAPRDRPRASLLPPEEQRAWLEAILGSTDDAIVGKRLDGTIVMWSAGAERLYGYSTEEALGQNIELVVPESLHGELDPVFDKLRAGERVPPYETTRICKNGRELPVSLTVSPVTDAQGTPIGAWSIARDVSRERASREQLRAAKEAAEQASQAKDRFLAVLSHELRTPLTPVLTAIQTLTERDDVDDEIQQALRIIRRNVELESRLIDDLLDLTRISRGKLTLELETADASALLRDAVEICGDTLQSKRIDVEVDCDASVLPVRADAARLRQVFWNLLDNAAKFTPEEGSVIASCRGAGDDVLIEVTDTGVGIEDDRLARIFDAFEQGTPVQALRSGGLGLGLAICKALVAMHGGDITAHSAGADRGSTFRIRLPRSEGRVRSPHPTPELNVGQARQGAHILLVEDHEDSAVLMKGLLERAGHTVDIAVDVAEGVERALSGHPDLIVSDLGLPDGSGIDLLAKVREAGVDVPAIALSGYGMDDDVQRTREAGFVTHLVKPVGVKRLREAVLEVLSDAER